MEGLRSVLVETIVIDLGHFPVCLGHCLSTVALCSGVDERFETGVQSYFWGTPLKPLTLSSAVWTPYRPPAHPWASLEAHRHRKIPPESQTELDS